MCSKACKGAGEIEKVIEQPKPEPPKPAVTTTKTTTTTTSPQKTKQAEKSDVSPISATVEKVAPSSEKEEPPKPDPIQISNVTTQPPQPVVESVSAPITAPQAQQVVSVEQQKPADPVKEKVKPAEQQQPAVVQQSTEAETESDQVAELPSTAGIKERQRQASDGLSMKSKGSSAALGKPSLLVQLRKKAASTLSLVNLSASLASDDNSSEVLESTFLSVLKFIANQRSD